MLGRVERVKGYHDITRYPEPRLIPGRMLFRWDAPLFFANADLFHERVLDAVASSPTPGPLGRGRGRAGSPESMSPPPMHSASSTIPYTPPVSSCVLLKGSVKDKLKRFGSSLASASRPSRNHR
ncbi:hypothetical protein [Edaphobacter modestus]|uniref:hypothetical protein n=1 Tax=Edaphobacter modestus TaxID=388466 RepID=UPI001A92E10E|nr:hypothetical protein [Edaphobacter modestus]